MTNIIDLAPLTTSKPGAHTYGRKLRRAMVPMSMLELIMTMDGTKAYRFEGWPEGAKIVGVKEHLNPFMLELFLFREDFPPVAWDEYPSLIKVTAKAVN